MADMVPEAFSFDVGTPEDELTQDLRDAAKVRLNLAMDRMDLEDLEFTLAFVTKLMR